MLPGPLAHDVADHAVGDAVFGSEVAVLLASRSTCTDGPDVIIGEVSSRVIGPEPAVVGAVGYGVAGVLALRSEVKVGWSNTGGDVASVQDAEAIGDWPIREFPGNAMSADHCVPDSNTTVPTVDSRGGKAVPQPATSLGCRYLHPEPFCERQSMPCHGGIVRQWRV